MHGTKTQLLFIYLPVAVIVLLITKYILYKIKMDQKVLLILKSIFIIFVLLNITFFILSNNSFHYFVYSIIFRDTVILIDLSVLMVITGIKLIMNNPNNDWKRGLGAGIIGFPISWIIISLIIKSPYYVS